MYFEADQFWKNPGSSGRIASFCVFFYRPAVLPEESDVLFAKTWANLLVVVERVLSEVSQSPRINHLMIVKKPCFSISCCVRLLFHVKKADMCFYVPWLSSAFVAISFFLFNFLPKQKFYLNLTETRCKGFFEQCNNSNSWVWKQIRVCRSLWKGRPVATWDYLSTSGYTRVWSFSVSLLQKLLILSFLTWKNVF